MLKTVIHEDKQKAVSVSYGNGYQRNLLPDEDLIRIKVELYLDHEVVAEQRFLMLLKNNTSRLIVCFHGYMGVSEGEGYAFWIHDPLKKSSVIFPQDRDGYNRSGSWHLGKLISYKDSHVHSSILIIRALLKYLSNEYQFSNTVMMGSSMGGYGAICHSLFNTVDQVFIAVPQTTLSPHAHYFKRGKQYWDLCESASRNQLSKFLQPILPIDRASDFSTLLDKMPYLDIAKAIGFSQESKSLVIEDFELPFQLSSYYHLIGTRKDDFCDINHTYMRDMYLPFINSLATSQINFSVDILPVWGHDQYIYPVNIEGFLEQHIKYTLSSSLENKDCIGSYKHIKENELFKFHLWSQPTA